MNGEFTLKKSVIVLVASVLSVVYSLSVIMCSVLQFTGSSVLSGNTSSNTMPSAFNTAGSSRSDSFNVSSSDASSDTTPDPLPAEVMTPPDEMPNEPDNNVSEPSVPVVAPPKNDDGSTAPPEPSEPTEPPKAVPSSFKSAIWYTYYELSFIGLDENAFRSKINKMFDDAVSTGTTDVICHVRPYADAFYRSAYFPVSYYVSGSQGTDPGYDPLQYMVSAAHARGLKIHAWINPYRVANSDDISKLSQSSPAYKWRTDGNSDTDRNVISWGGKLYFNPGRAEVRKLIIDGVREIVDNYDVDGVQIDDYFYPTSPGATEEFDSTEYNAYKDSSGGNYLSLPDWRRANVSALVSGIYSAVHASKSNVIFGVSPAASISKDHSDANYNSHYADVTMWMSNKGYIDYIAPQLYFGYEYKLQSYRFNNLLSLWTSLPRADGVEIYIGLASYKVGKTDAGSQEWIEKSDILGRQVEDSFAAGCNGVIVFSYSSLMDNNSLKKAERDSYVAAVNSVKSRIG